MTARTLGLLALVALGCKRQPPPAPPAPPAPAPAAAPVSPADAAARPAGWDPVALVRQGADPIEVFVDSPRAEAWARAAEDVLGAQMTRDVRVVLPDAPPVTIECRTLGCVVGVAAPADRLAVAREAVKLVMLGPIMVDLGVDEKGRAQVLFLTEPRFADPQEFVGWYRRVRRRTIEEIRAGKQPNPLPVPATALPLD